MFLYSILKKNAVEQTVLVLTIVSLLMVGYGVMVFNISSFSSVWSMIFTLILIFATILLIKRINEVYRFVPHRSYAIFFYATLLFFFPHSLKHINIIIANLLTMIAFMKILSIANSLSVKQKILDSSLLILTASLFYIWSIFFLILVEWAIVVFAPKSAKNFLIPIIAFVPLSAFLFLFHLIYPQIHSFSHLWNLSFYIHQEKYQNWQYLFPLSVIIVTGLVSVIHFFYYQSKGNPYKNSKLLLGLVFICTGIAVLSPPYDGAEHIFLFTPLCLFLSVLCEHIKKKLFKEFLLTLFALIPLGILMFFLSES